MSRTLALVVALAAAGPSLAATAWPDIDTAFLDQWSATRGFRLGQPTQVRVAPGGDAVLFLRTPPRSFVADLYSFDTVTGTTTRLLSAEDLLGGVPERLSVEEKARRERMRHVTRGIASFDLSEDGARILVPLSDRLFLVERATRNITELHPRGGFPLDPRLSPDAKHVACVIDGDLYVLDVAKDRQRRLTRRKSPTESNGVAEFVAQEEMYRREGYWWSPDGGHIAFTHVDESGVPTWHLSDATHPDQPPTAFRYPAAGTANARVRLGIISSRGGPTTWVAWDRERYPYVARVTWERNAPLTIVVQDRAQHSELVLAIDPRTGTTTELLAEHDAAWLNLDAHMPRWLPDGSGFLWSTERSGSWTMELRGRAGALVRTLVPATLGYRTLAGIDEEGGLAWIVAGDEPTQAHVVRVPLDGGAPERVTHADGLHGVVIARRGGVQVLTSTLRSGEVQLRVLRRDGMVVGHLETVAETPPWMANVEWTTVDVADRRHHAAIIRPRILEPGRALPVIVSVYGGPGGIVVHASRRSYLQEQWLADAGFIVVAMDGRGTPRRGREWERAIRGDLLGTALADQSDILGALAASRPEMDLSRVGITGWSFGGYMAAAAVMLRPDVFHAALAGAPVTDWRLYDTHYTERYMGLPSENGDGYERASLLAHAGELRRPLLLIHGTTDDNVYFVHSLQLAQALFRAGRPFEFLPLAGFTHQVPDPVVNRELGLRKVAFFREHLQ